MARRVEQTNDVNRLDFILNSFLVSPTDAKLEGFFVKREFKR